MVRSSSTGHAVTLSSLALLQEEYCDVSNVKGSHAAGMRVEQLAQESELLHFFSHKGMGEEGFVLSGAETQYGLAAKQILSAQD